MKSALVLLALALAGGKALAADTPQIIQRMLAAADTLSYRGHVVQIEGDQAQSLHVLHRAGADGGLDRIRSLQGTYWELRREGQNCRIALSTARPAHDEALVAAAFASLLPRRLQKLAEFYEFAPVGTGRLADHAAEFTLARPRDQFRFGYLLGTDTATGLLLKAGLIDHQGKVLRQVFFVDLELVKTLDDAEWLQEAGSRPPNLQWREHTLGQRPSAQAIPWTIGALPPGFSVSGYIRRPSPAGGQDVEQLTISDGLATVSVFIDSPAPGEQSLVGAGRVQAMPAFGAQLAGRQVTALGAAPMATLKQVVEALTPAAPASLATPAALPATSGAAP
jgi:sigma-E factor negative regulatory protein RseB